MSVPDPPNIQIRPKSTSQTLEFWWGAPTNIGGSPITRYDLICASPSQTYQFGPTERYANITGLTNGQVYAFTLVARNSAGPSLPAAFRVVDPGNTTGAPKNVTFSASSGSTFTATVSWSAPTPIAGDGIIGWYLFSAIPSVGPKVVKAAHGYDRTRSISGLNPALQYRYLLQAISNAGYSEPVVLDVPGQPTGLQAAAGNQQAVLTWIPSSFTGGSPITNYKYSLNNGAYTQFNPPITDTTATATITDLSNGVLYTIRIKAVNALGDSVASNSVTVTPAAGSVLMVAGGFGPNTLAYTNDGVTWIGSTSGNGVFNNGVCYALALNGSRLLAGGKGNNPFAYSDNSGVTWDSSGNGRNIIPQCNALAYGNRWVAGGVGTNTLAYSDNGINWTGLGIDSPFTVVCWAVAYGSSLWVAGGYGTNTLAYSDDGIEWTGLGTGIFTNACNAVAYGGSRWVAGGVGTNTLAYSDNGINWTGLGIDSPFTVVCWAVAYGSSLWVAGGEGAIAYSDNSGVSWILSEFAGFDNCYAVAYNGSQWIAGGDGMNRLAYSDDGIEWTPSSSGNSVFKTECRTVIWDGSQWVAGGGGMNIIAYSTDGITWTPSTSPTFNSGACIAVAYSGSRWLAGSYMNNTLAYSNDGVTWDVSGNGDQMFESYLTIAYGNRWVAGGVGEDTNTLAYSDDGIDWTGLGSDIFTEYCYAIAWNGSRWVAGGYGGNVLAYSPDGVMWIASDNGNQIFTESCRAVAWNGSRWVAGGAGENTLAYSYDGVEWTGLGTGIFTNACNAVAWNGSRWVAGGNVTNTLAYSDDGVTWVKSENGNEIVPNGCNTVAWNGTQWVAGNVDAFEGTDTVALAYSPDGETWDLSGNINEILDGCFGLASRNVLPYLPKEPTAPSAPTGLYAAPDDQEVTLAWVLLNDGGSPVTNYMYSIGGGAYTAFEPPVTRPVATIPGLTNDISYNIRIKAVNDISDGAVSDPITVIPGNFVVAGGSGLNDTLAYSNDGSIWTGLGKGVLSVGCFAVAYNGSRWVAGGEGTHTLAYSDNGIEWTGIGTNSPFTDFSCFAVAYGGSRWVAGGSGTNTLAYSPDGIEWTGIGTNSPFTESCRAVAWNGSRWVAGGAGGNTLAYSPDGIEWTGLGNDSPFTVGCNAVAWNGSRWVAGGAGGNTLAYSPDGIEWTGLGNNSPIDDSCSAVAWNGSRWVAGGDGTNPFAYSDDGEAWFASENGNAIFTGQCNAVAWNGSRWVAGGVGTNTFAYSYDGETWYPSANGTGFFDAGCYAVASRTILPYRYTIRTVPRKPVDLYAAPDDQQVTLAWTAGYDGGSPITNYMYSISGEYIEFDPPVTGTVATITGLDNDISYNIQIKAMNEFGDGAESDPITVIPGNFVVAGGDEAQIIPYSNDGITWDPSGNAILTECYAVAYGGSRWVAGGLGGLAYSDDGIVWIASENGNNIFTEQCNAVAWNGSRWVAGGSGTNTLAYSTDGITWDASGTNIFTNGCQAVAYGSRWVAGGSGGNTLAYSPDGIEWTGLEGDTPFTVQCNAVAWNGSRWVAGGDGTNTLAYSDDGVIWIASENGNAIFNYCYAVAWNGSRWVAGGDGTNPFAYSDDGEAWFASENGNAIFTGECNAVAWNGSRWVAGGVGTNTLAYSYDGETWYPSANGTGFFEEGCYAVASRTILPYRYTIRTVPRKPVDLYAAPDDQQVTLAWTAGYDGGSPITNYMYSISGEYIEFDPPVTGTVATITGLDNDISYNIQIKAMNEFGDGAESDPITVIPGNFVVAGGTGSNSLAYSNDGISWIGLGNAIIEICNAVAWNGSRWVAGCEGETRLAYSDNGVTWIASGNGNEIFTESKTVAWNGSRWVAGGEGDHRLAYSDNSGVTWELSGNGDTIFTEYCNAVAYGGNRWVAGGNAAIAYSPDGIEWTPSGNMPFSACHAVAYNGTRWVAGGSGTNPFAYSDDGIEWYASENGTGFFTYNRCNALAWNGSRWVAGGSGTNPFAYSDDGIEWYASENGTGFFEYQICRTVAWNGSQWVAGGFGTNSLAYSYDGETWYPSANGNSFFTETGCYAVASRTILPYRYTIRTVPRKPLGLQCIPGDGQVTLERIATNDGGSPITLYQYSIDDGVSYAGFIPDDNAYIIEDLINNTAYTIRIRAENDFGFGLPSDPITVTPNVKPVLIDGFAEPLDAEIRISWTVESGGPITKYYYSFIGEDISGEFDPPQENVYTIDGLLNGRASYYPLLEAANNSGPLNKSDPLLFNPVNPGVAPSAPRDLSAIDVDIDSVTIGWLPPLNTGSYPTSNYYYTVNDGSDNYVNDFDASEYPASYTITGLTTGATYTIALKAGNTPNAPKSIPSNTITIIPNTYVLNPGSMTCSVDAPVVDTEVTFSIADLPPSGYTGEWIIDGAPSSPDVSGEIAFTFTTAGPKSIQYIIHFAQGPTKQITRTFYVVAAAGAPITFNAGSVNYFKVPNGYSALSLDLQGAGGGGGGGCLLREEETVLYGGGGGGGGGGARLVGTGDISGAISDGLFLNVVVPISGGPRGEVRGNGSNGSGAIVNLFDDIDTPYQIGYFSAGGGSGGTGARNISYGIGFGGGPGLYSQDITNTNIIFNDGGSSFGDQGGDGLQNGSGGSGGNYGGGRGGDASVSSEQPGEAGQNGSYTITLTYVIPPVELYPGSMTSNVEVPVVGGDVTFTIAGLPPVGYTDEWYINDDLSGSNTGGVFETSFADPGPVTIRYVLKIADRPDQEITRTFYVVAVAEGDITFNSGSINYFKIPTRYGGLELILNGAGGGGGGSANNGGPGGGGGGGAQILGTADISWNSITTGLFVNLVQPIYGGGGGATGDEGDVGTDGSACIFKIFDTINTSDPVEIGYYSAGGGYGGSSGAGFEGVGSLGGSYEFAGPPVISFNDTGSSNGSKGGDQGGSGGGSNGPGSGGGGGNNGAGDPGSDGTYSFTLKYQDPDIALYPGSMTPSIEVPLVGSEVIFSISGLPESGFTSEWYNGEDSIGTDASSVSVGPFATPGPVTIRYVLNILGRAPKEIIRTFYVVAEEGDTMTFNTGSVNYFKVPTGYTALAMTLNGAGGGGGGGANTNEGGGVGGGGGGGAQLVGTGDISSNSITSGLFVSLLAPIYGGGGGAFGNDDVTGGPGLDGSGCTFTVFDYIDTSAPVDIGYYSAGGGSGGGGAAYNSMGGRGYGGGFDDAGPSVINFNATGSSGGDDGYGGEGDNGGDNGGGGGGSNGPGIGGNGGSGGSGSGSGDQGSDGTYIFTLTYQDPDIAIYPGSMISDTEVPVLGQTVIFSIIGLPASGYTSQWSINGVNGGSDASGFTTTLNTSGPVSIGYSLNILGRAPKEIIRTFYVVAAAGAPITFNSGSVNYFKIPTGYTALALTLIGAGGGSGSNSSDGGDGSYDGGVGGNGGYLFGTGDISSNSIATGLFFKLNAPIYAGSSGNYDAKGDDAMLRCFTDINTAPVAAVGQYLAGGGYNGGDATESGGGDAGGNGTTDISSPPDITFTPYTQTNDGGSGSDGNGSYTITLSIPTSINIFPGSMTCNAEVPVLGQTVTFSISGLPTYGYTDRWVISGASNQVNTGGQREIELTEAGPISVQYNLYIIGGPTKQITRTFYVVGAEGDSIAFNAESINYFKIPSGYTSLAMTLNGAGGGGGVDGGGGYSGGGGGGGAQIIGTGDISSNSITTGLFVSLVAPISGGPGGGSGNNGTGGDSGNSCTLEVFNTINTSVPVDIGYYRAGGGGGGSGGDGEGSFGAGGGAGVVTNAGPSSISFTVSSSSGGDDGYDGNEGGGGGGAANNGPGIGGNSGNPGRPGSNGSYAITLSIPVINPTSVTIDFASDINDNPSDFYITATITNDYNAYQIGINDFEAGTTFIWTLGEDATALNTDNSQTISGLNTGGDYKFTIYNANNESIFFNTYTASIA